MTLPAEPYLRPAPPEGEPPLPCPPGWSAEPAGVWDGHHQEVVYNPRRHDVVIIRGGTSPSIEATFPGIGYAEARTSEDARMWVRDRFAMTQAALDRLQDRPVIAHELGRT